MSVGHVVVMGRRVRVNAQGETWCHHRDWKRTYFSLEEAWLAAFVLFVRTGSITTPYRCNQSKKHSAVARIRVRENPWAFDPFVRWVGSRKVRVQGCGMWHLTSRASQSLADEAANVIE